MESTSNSSSEYTEVIKDFNEKKLKELDEFINTPWLPWEEKGDFKLVYRDEKSGFRSIKSEVIVNKDMKTVYEFVHNLENKPKFDSGFDSGRIFAEIDDNFSIHYQKYKGKFMISPRDFVNLAYAKFDENRSIVVHVGTKHEKLPEISGNVRAELVFGGFFFEKVDENNTKVTFFSCADLKLNQTLVNTSLKEVACCVKNIKKLLDG